ncbi:MAG: HNH endonuclease, partial [Streptosporangiales bacterium]|nr:HNH endonuclease [Streptosporangiales bacterium]
PTAAENLGPLCRRHHDLKQQPGWNVRRDPDGSYTWTSPTGHTYTTPPPDTHTTPPEEYH